MNQQLKMVMAGIMAAAVASAASAETSKVLTLKGGVADGDMFSKSPSLYGIEYGIEKRFDNGFLAGIEAYFDYCGTSKEENRLGEAAFLAYGFDVNAGMAFGDADVYLIGSFAELSIAKASMAYGGGAGVGYRMDGWGVGVEWKHYQVDWASDYAYGDDAYETLTAALKFYF